MVPRTIGVPEPGHFSPTIHCQGCPALNNYFPPWSRRSFRILIVLFTSLLAAASCMVPANRLKLHLARISVILYVPGALRLFVTFA